MRRLVPILAILFEIACCAVGYGDQPFSPGRLGTSLKLSQPLLADQLFPVTSANADATNPEAKSREVMPFRAFLQSLVIPGWGQKSVGKGTTVGTITFVTDVVLWGAVVGFNAYGNWKRDAYKTFAAAHAGVDNRNKDHLYYVDIGNYQDLDQFNEQRRRDRAFDELYLSPADWWEWDSISNRLHFRSLRIQSDAALNDRYYVLGAIFLNHLFSAVHASREAARVAHSGSNSARPSPRVELIPELRFGEAGGHASVGGIGDSVFGLCLTGRF